MNLGISKKVQLKKRRERDKKRKMEDDEQDRIRKMEDDEQDRIRKIEDAKFVKLYLDLDKREFNIIDKIDELIEYSPYPKNNVDKKLIKALLKYFKNTDNNDSVSLFCHESLEK